MKVAVSSHPWSEEALLSKALLYIQRMEALPADDAQFGLWSALALELLARATLAHISPVLLADDSNWRNLAFALGEAPTVKKFSPASIGAKDVFARLNELRPTLFTTEIAGFCVEHIGRRNSELHTGELPFESLGTSGWLPKFYRACAVLLGCMNRELADLVFDPDGATTMIAALEDAAAKAVNQDIKAHSQVWENRTAAERENGIRDATAWATREAGHRVTCPACHSPALLQGSPSGSVATDVREDEVVQRQTMLPSSFACIACGLRIFGLSRLTACGLGDAFTARTPISIAEFFGLYTEDDLERARRENEPEPDFNEYE